MGVLGRVDPSKPKKQRRPSEEVDIDTFIVINNQNEVTTEALFCAKLAQVKGTLVVGDDKLIFKPDKRAEENKKVSENSLQEGHIGYEDITDVDILTLINEGYVDSESQFLREQFKYDYFI